MKKITTNLLLVALLLSMASCGSTPDATKETTAPVTTDTVEAEDTTIRSSLPALDYNGDSFTVFVEDYGGYVGVEFYVEDINGEIVNDAVYNRNQTVSEQLNVALDWVGLTHTWETREEYLTKLRSSVLAATSEFDIATGIGYFMPSFVSEGLLTDLSSLPYLDIEKPWWSKSYMDNAAVDGRYYAATGDISLGMIKYMMCVFENMEFADKLGVESLYDVVRAGDWTLDKMKALTSDVYSDLNGNGKYDREDQYGLLFHNPNHFTGFLEPFDVTIVEFQGDDAVLAYGNAHNIDVVEKLVDLISDNEGIYFDPTGNHETVDDSIFRDGNVLLTTGWLCNTDTYRDLEYDYGVLPYPKYDETYTEYKTTVLNNHSVVAIPVDAKDPERSAGILEALAYESWKSVTPAYFEVALKAKYARDDDTAQMFDLIRDGISFDFGYIYTASLDGINDMFKNTIVSKKPWASTFAASEKALTTKLDALVEAIRDKAE